MLIWRRLKRLLRRRRTVLSLALVLLCVGAAGLLSSSFEPESQEAAVYEWMFIGLSEQDELTLYQGPPEYNQVIETFFRIDTERLKTERPLQELEHLKAGIQIRSAEEYEAVLNRFSPYAAER